MIHLYGVYGLTIRSNRPIEGMLPPIDGAAEVIIDFAGIADPPLPPQTPLCTIDRFQKLWQLDAGRYLLRYQSWIDPREAWSVVITPDRLTIHWSAGIDPTDIPTVLQGGALACLLLLRDVPALHAAAIDVGGAAILILGDSGAGKSTTAAALIRHGCRLVADDTAALERRGTSVVVHPGLPRLRILEDSAQSLGWDVRSLHTVFRNDFNGRKWFIEGEATSNEPLRVSAIYILRERAAGRGDAAIETMTPVRALGDLLRHSHGAVVPDRARTQTLFESLRAIVGLVPVHEVRAVDALEQLPVLAAALVRRA